MVYEDTEQGLIQVNLGYLADQHQLSLDIGRMEKDSAGRWIVPLATPAGLPPSLSPEQYSTALQELAQRLQSEHQLQVQFAMPQQ